MNVATVLYAYRKSKVNALLHAAHEGEQAVFYDGKFRFYKFSEYGDDTWCMERGLRAAKIYDKYDKDDAFLFSTKQEE